MTIARAASHAARGLVHSVELVEASLDVIARRTLSRPSSAVHAERARPEAVPPTTLGVRDRSQAAPRILRSRSRTPYRLSTGTYHAGSHVHDRVGAADAPFSRRLHPRCDHSRGRHQPPQFRRSGHAPAKTPPWRRPIIRPIVTDLRADRAEDRRPLSRRAWFWPRRHRSRRSFAVRRLACGIVGLTPARIVTCSSRRDSAQPNRSRHVVI